MLDEKVTMFLHSFVCLFVCSFVRSFVLGCLRVGWRQLEKFQTFRPSFASGFDGGGLKNFGHFGLRSCQGWMEPEKYIEAKIFRSVDLFKFSLIRLA